MLEKLVHTVTVNISSLPVKCADREKKYMEGSVSWGKNIPPAVNHRQAIKA